MREDSDCPARRSPRTARKPTHRLFFRKKYSSALDAASDEVENQSSHEQHTHDTSRGRCAITADAVHRRPIGCPSRVGRRRRQPTRTRPRRPLRARDDGSIRARRRATTVGRQRLASDPAEKAPPNVLDDQRLVGWTAWRQRRFLDAFRAPNRRLRQGPPCQFIGIPPEKGGLTARLPLPPIPLPTRAASIRLLGSPAIPRRESFSTPPFAASTLRRKAAHQHPRRDSGILVAGAPSSRFWSPMTRRRV